MGSGVATVLVVEDEPDLRTLVAHHLEAAGMEALQAGTCREALVLARTHRPDLVVLDVMLPDGSGIDVCRQLRADPQLLATAVIMLTARTAESDRIAGLEAGADDYVPKPFSTRELMLRVRAVLRRHGPTATSDPGVLLAGQIAIDITRHTATVQGQELKLTALEFRLLSTLVQRRGKVQSRRQLLQDVWEMNPDLHTRTVDTHVKRLRERLGAAGDAIETVRGVGYRCIDSAS